jgi:hypothetical protein
MVSDNPEVAAPNAVTDAPVADLEARFWESPYGQARRAKLAGHRYFQTEMWIDSTYQDSTTPGISTTTRRNSSLTEILTHVETEGWELIHAGFVFREAGQVSRDKFLSSGQQVATTGTTFGIYLFRATDTPARSDEVWLSWASTADMTDST